MIFENSANVRMTHFMNSVTVNAAEVMIGIYYLKY